ncbi:tryptophan transporter [Virgibacillus dakarensis]|uniref:Tryptophan transport protein n=1 Tax=Lentibacillus populi TaxID=1827502 RepID=A0A9W5X6F8_9BACI|nr:MULTISPECIES: tryptophan transporter [Bacillaceae]MBT2215331.1 tryptophan transporter [Virgibacillus dakarensis]MTW85501.1 tryptophan transporter [Virgibacillus dakarensis]GGB51613.1 putative tryptophan transport protein [Lentibacillus populi]
MNTKVLIILSLFMGIGAVLHAVVPAILFGMKPDMLLTMMFLGIMLFPKTKYVVLLAIVTGILSALTTMAPGGQIANIIDKPITAALFFGLFLLIKDKVNGNISAPILTAIGTIVSGSVFIASALYIVGLMDGAFPVLFVTIVLPTALVNTIVMVVIYPIVGRILKRSRPITVS